MRWVRPEERFSPRLPLAAGLSFAFLVSAFAFHLIFLRRAKRDLGF